jgi:hypothetical protein
LGLEYSEVSGPGDLPFYGRGSMIVTAATTATMTAMTVRMMTSTAAAMMTKLGQAYCPVEHLSASGMQHPSTTESVLRRTKRDPVSFVGMAFSVMAVISWILLR